jgi:hypothetical protein
MVTADLPRAQTALRELVAALSRGQYATLAADGRAGRSSAEDLERVIAEYGHSLCPLPEGGASLFDVVPLADGTGWAVDVDLWTAEQGRSDLTLSATITPDDTGGFVVSIDTIRVQ